MTVDQIQLFPNIVEPLDLFLNCGSVLAKGFADAFGSLALKLDACHRPGYVANQQDLFTRCEVHVNHLRTRRVARRLDQYYARGQRVQLVVVNDEVLVAPTCGIVAPGTRDAKVL